MKRKTWIVGLAILLSLGSVAAIAATSTVNKRRSRTATRTVASAAMNSYNNTMKEDNTEDIVKAHLLEELAKESVVNQEDLQKIVSAYADNKYVVKAYHYGYGDTPSDTGKALETYFGKTIGTKAWLYLVATKDGETTQYFGSKDKPVLVTGR